MYKLGEKVQAVDELGRWCSAKLVDTTLVDLEPERHKVSFLGWGTDCDREVRPHEIRKIVDPFKEDLRVGSKRRSCLMTNRELLKKLCQGDTILQHGDDGSAWQTTVHLVDPFKRTVTVHCAGEENEVSVALLSMPTESKSADSAVAPRRSTTGRPKNTRNITSEVEEPCTEIQGSVGGPPIRVYFWTCLSSRGLNVVVGQVYKVFGLICAVTRLFMDQAQTLQQMTAETVIVTEEKLDREVTMSLPINKLYAAPANTDTMSKEDRAFLQLSHKKAKEESIQSLRGGEIGYRALYRRNQVASAFRREIASGLKSRSRYRRFTFGLIVIELDGDIFHFHGKKAIYGYGKNNRSMKELDSLLGEMWDISTMEHLTQFATQVSVWQTKDDQLSASIRSAVCREQVLPVTGYREQLEAHLLECPGDMDMEEDETELVDTHVTEC